MKRYQEPDSTDPLDAATGCVHALVITLVVVSLITVIILIVTQG